ncbi:amino acid/polyamine transporter I [Talaromyces proteolyticus]|uniref:Amino acid/polyamine transporter I n=1 Tax=Talaromyces proteolyticus TaxID=1131652 RepID=A0AAD4Q6L4_9EURO|nr:amino acid/polyamine transporter I [Talaromyces proteolyticus]KAH8705821.1 amino acid/polyamine transporter I [Talaromyces proteolyticus]
MGATENNGPHDINGFSILALGFNICNSWIGMASSLAIGITLGGTVTVLYGALVTTVIYLATAATLAELSSIYPTAGGQYHFTSLLAPKRYSRSLSYACGIVSAFSWISLSAAVAILNAQLLIAIAVIWNPDYAPQAWHYFLIYQTLAFLLLLSNLFVIKRAPWLHDIGFILTLTSFIVILITCISCSNHKQPSDFVWKTWINETGWPDGICFLTGLVTPAFMYAGLDAALHLAEECTHPEKTVPKAVMSSVVIGFVTAFSFAIAMLYALGDFEAVLATATRMPIIEIYLQATGSRVATTVFAVMSLSIGCFSLNAIQQTSSRLTWALARDNAFVFSTVVSRIQPTLQVPVWALLGNFGVIFCCGCLYLASTTAFNALVGIGIVLQQLSFAFPAALLLYRKRSTRFLLSTAPFRLNSALGWAANALVVVSALIWFVFFQFPVTLPVTSSNMNYACVVTGCMCLLGGVNWIIHGKAHYRGPRIEYGLGTQL